MHTIVRMESCMGMGWLFLVCCHFLLFHFSFSHSLCHSHDNIALLQFKTSFTVNTTHYDGTRSYYRAFYDLCLQVDQKTTTWENGTDCCSWLGVTCHPISGHVTGLDLSCNGLHGKIHPNSSLFSLSHLQSLNLAFNDLSDSQFSSLFVEFVSLTHLNLSNCNFEDEIPPQISYLSKLQSLDLSYNSFLIWKESSWKRLLQNATVLNELVLDYTNMFSTSITTLNMSSSLVTLSLVFTQLRGNLTNDIPCLPHLQELYLSNNNFLPDQQFPNLSCSAASLRILDLSWNNLNGSIPSSLLTLPHLTSLNLRACVLSGQIPNVFHHSNKFEELDLSLNDIRGELPSTLSNLQHLIHLDLSENKLSGQIPSFLSNLQHLIHLDLSENKLSGQIPSFLSNLQHLIHLDLSYNVFTGQIPSRLFDLPQLSHLDFSYNKLEGPLPDKITGFSNGTGLWLNNNLLNGTMPSWCFSLPSLLHLYLSNNQFTGNITAISSNSLQSLYLCYNKLQGNIPESILNLVNLTHLCLSSNSFSDPDTFSLFSNVNYSFSLLETLHLSSIGLTQFPKLSGKVPMLRELVLSNNKLNGTVPKWLHEMDSLKCLNLSQNLLSTPLDPFSGNYQLEVLDLSLNSLTGDISSSICNASIMRILNLSHNKLTGIFPQCLATLSTLRVLDLQMNKLYGTLPSTFSMDSLLCNLNLYGNQLQGLLPKSLSNCTQLEVLNLGNNQIEGTFPHWLQTLSFLEVLVLRANKLHGPIVNIKTKNGLPNLVIFDISSNNFSGPIPKVFIQNFKAMKNVFQDKLGKSLQQYMETWTTSVYADSVTVSLTTTTKGNTMTFNKIPKSFAYMDFSRNKFEGEIPNVIGELHALIGLNLSHNRLSGPIPQSMGNLTNLESLDLSSNMLTGGIPTELVNLNFLEVLNVSHNRLVGEIPQGKQFNTFSNDSFEGNLGLCGVPLSMKCREDPEQHSSPSLSFWREEKFGFGWKPVAIGYGCGMVFGVGIGCCVLLTGKPQWLVRMVGG